MRSLWRRHRGPVLLGGALVGAFVILALVAGSAPVGTLDPNGYDPSGAHALSVLLKQRGVEVTRTDDVSSTVAAAAADTTVFVPLPSTMSKEELQAVSSLPGGLVVAEADPDALSALRLDASAVGEDDPARRSPACDLGFAKNAGRARAGGVEYTAPGGTPCYPGNHGASLVSVDDGRVVLLGAADALTNKYLDQDGNAALGIGLLAQRPRVVWLVPSPTRATFGQRPITSPDDLLPGWVRAARWQLFVAAVVLALWRGRRLGRVVFENLPVVVRAAETVEGHGRLYHAARSRASAAEALREATRRHLSRALHGGGSASPDVLADLVAARSRRDASAVRALLYGPAPADDDALVSLANDLDTLTSEALTREGAGT